MAPGSLIVGIRLPASKVQNQCRLESVTKPDFGLRGCRNTYCSIASTKQHLRGDREAWDLGLIILNFCFRYTSAERSLNAPLTIDLFVGLCHLTALTNICVPPSNETAVHVTSARLVRRGQVKLCARWRRIGSYCIWNSLAPSFVSRTSAHTEINAIATRPDEQTCEIFDQIHFEGLRHSIIHIWRRLQHNGCLVTSISHLTKVIVAIPKLSVDRTTRRMEFNYHQATSELLTISQPRQTEVRKVNTGGEPRQTVGDGEHPTIRTESEVTVVLGLAGLKFPAGYGAVAGYLRGAGSISFRASSSSTATPKLSEYGKYRRQNPNKNMFKPNRGLLIMMQSNQSKTFRAHDSSRLFNSRFLPFTHDSTRLKPINH
ncbi:uncharacterized protein CLUP02_18248 [Colletotrichum lupini]|uniref:Uncharacterized protein n=1 Tax=Colletotrichum lupini TaxID=145971 RepID=A0A9Q8WAL1_9PEZI|nr:uncharacterized protein CLUP02_18248 [Colletotrichum lupini]UQC76733.1 hypothetical protein CLUP02_18248 [Colletotrichum lupini]